MKKSAALQTASSLAMSSLEKISIETFTTDPASHCNQIGKVFVAAYLHHGLAPEIVNQKRPSPESAL